MTGTPIFDDLVATFQAGLLVPRTTDHSAPRATSTQVPPDDEVVTWSLTGRVTGTARPHA